MRKWLIYLLFVVIIVIPSIGHAALSPSFVNGWTGTTSIVTSSGPQIQAGDFLVYSGSTYYATSIVHPTGGSGNAWTNTVPFFSCINKLGTAVWTRFAAAGDVGATFTPYNSYSGGGIADFRGVNPITPIDAAGSGSTDCTGSSSTVTAASITLNYSGDALLWIAGAYSLSTEPTMTVPATYSTGFNLAPVSGVNMGSALGYTLGNSSGATGNVSGSVSLASLWNTVLIGLQAAATPTPTPTATPTPTPAPTAFYNETVQWVNASGDIMNCGSQSSTTATPHSVVRVVDANGKWVNAFAGSASATTASYTCSASIVNGAGDIVNGSASATSATADIYFRVVSSTGHILSPGTDSGTPASYNKVVRVVDSSNKVCDAL